MFRSKHFSAIITKFLLAVTVMGLLYAMMGYATTGTAVVAAVCFSFFGYLLADLIILPRYGNRIGVLVDIALAALISRVILQYMENASLPPLILLVACLLIGAGEWYYHQNYLTRVIFRRKLKP